MEEAVGLCNHIQALWTPQGQARDGLGNTLWRPIGNLLETWKLWRKSEGVVEVEEKFRERYSRT